MAVPKILRPIDTEKAVKLIAKHLEAGTGWWEYAPGEGDFIYKTEKGRSMLIRETMRNKYETGQVCG